MSKRTQITLLRGGLLAGYMLAAAFLVVFFSAAGDGSYAPGAVLLGWGIVPWQLDIVPGAFGFLLPPILYLVCLFIAVTAFPRSLLPLGFHIIGVFIAVVSVKQGHLAVGGWLWMSYIVPCLFALGYLWCDQWLARRAQRGASGNSRPTEVLTGL